VVVLGGLVWLVQLRRSPERRARVRVWLDERRDRPGWRYVARVARPLWRLVGRPTAWGADLTARFGLARLTPGDLGLELTTLLALFAVGAFTFFFIGEYAFDVGTPDLDRMAADVADRLASDPLIELAKMVTYIGSLWVIVPVALATTIWAAVQRRWIDAATIVAGVALSVILVQVSKAAYDRTRPPDALVHADYSAYPSGHTAYAVTLVACATILVRAGTGWAGRFAAVIVACALVVVVGATRVYLRVHHLTDVIGGAALGVAIWALVGTIALIAGHVRQNGGERDAP
jgi:undecaprenyl-diphosphatase